MLVCNLAILDNCTRPIIDKFSFGPSVGVVVAIAGFPGKAVGECLVGVAIILLGIAIGAGNFAILAKLRGSLVSQAIVFVIIVYIFALILATDRRYDSRILT